MPQEGVDRKKYLETKFGSRDLAVKAYTPVLEQANLAGLNLKLEDIAKTPNTLSSHRLILWAWQEGVQNAVVSALFKAYFSKAGKAQITLPAPPLIIKTFFLALSLGEVI